MRLKGYAITQLLGEAVIIMILVGMFYKASANFYSLSNAADMAANSMAYNISAMELIKNLSAAGSDIESLADFTFENGTYVTKITSLDVVSDGYPSLCRITVNTERNGSYVTETELVLYISIY